MIKLFLLNAMAFAEDAHHAAAGAHDAHAIPWGAIFIQSFNFFLLIGLLAFLLRKTVKTHFAHRAKDYQELVSRAENAKREAERGHAEIKARLDKLEAGASEGLERARREAAEMKTKLQAEARELSEKVEAEAKRSAQVELEKAKDELRRELLDSALQASHLTLKTSLNPNEQSRLQKEFVEKIQVVGG